MTHEPSILHLQRPDGVVAIERFGSGRPIVCVPGLGDVRGSYRHLIPQLVAAGHAVYAMDLRGHGASDTGFQDWSARAIGEDVVALLQAEDLRDVCVVGCSIGGGAAAWAASEAPERVSRLVLLNPFVRDMPADRWLRPLVPLLFATLWGALMWAMYRRTLFASPPEDHAASEAALREHLGEGGRMGAVRGMIRASKTDVEARLSQVEQPTLVVMGAKDPDFADPAGEGQTVADSLGGPTSVAVLDGVGHYPQAEAPERTAELVLRHHASGSTHAA